MISRHFSHQNYLVWSSINPIATALICYCWLERHISCGLILLDRSFHKSQHTSSSQFTLMSVSLPRWVLLRPTEFLEATRGLSPSMDLWIVTGWATCPCNGHFPKKQEQDLGLGIHEATGKYVAAVPAPCNWEGDPCKRMSGALAPAGSVCTGAGFWAL